MGLTLVLTKQDELNEIAELARVIWNDHYPAIVGQEQVDYMLDKMYSQDALLDQLINKKQMFYFIVDGEKKLGFISISYSIDTQEIFIHKFYILTQKQKSGVGSAVMGLIQDLYPNAKFYRLTVNRQNYKSINFYFKNGFIIDRVEDFDIGNGYLMNDFIMVKRVL